jgi:hypothetical protein
MDGTVVDDATSDVVISDTTLKEQAKIACVLPQAQKIDTLISELSSGNDGTVIRACTELSYRIFIPWLNKQNQANKIYFAKKGGIRLCVKSMLQSSNEALRCSAGTAVWNFAESGQMYDILCKDGALDALLVFLDSPLRLQRIAIGAFFGLLDYYMNFNSYFKIEIVQKILSVKEPTCATDWALCLGKAGSIVCLAKHPVSRKELIRLGAQNYLLQPKNDKFLDYLSCISLAHMAVHPHPLIPEDERTKILKEISRQFNILPDMIRAKERECGVVWKSMHHFKRFLMSDEPILRKFGLFCLANLSFSDYNRTIFGQDLLGYLVCLFWETGSEHEEYFKIIFENFSENPPFPSLVQICRFKGASLLD